MNNMDAFFIFVAFEIFNSFFDPNTFKVKIPPGISYDVNNVLDNQPLRLCLRTCDSKHVFAIIELALVFDSPT